ncbi:MAG: transglycosylase domain-containing protein, partial [Methylocella sp.]
MASRFRRSGLPGTIARIVRGAGLALALGIAALIVVYRFEPPVSTLMLARWLQGETVERRYVPLARISGFLRAAVIVSEDAHFCEHYGVDWGALRHVLDHPGAAGPRRG